MLHSRDPWCVIGLAAQDDVGRIEGQIIRTDGRAAAGVTVLLVETSATALSDSDGTFSFGGVASGSYTLALVSGTNTRTIPDVTVEAGSATTLETVVDWEVGFTDGLVVEATSRRLARTNRRSARVGDSYTGG